MKKIALRIDDIGASSKEFEVYSKRWFGLGNMLFLKNLDYFKAWAKYREMEAKEWYKVIELLKKYNAKLTVGITATWVNFDGSCIEFDKKFPEEAKALKYGLEEGVLEIANHGLTHCVLKNNLFRPKLFTSNRTYHREFWEWLGKDLHFEHIKKAQEILQNYFSTKITTLIPPGNVYCDYTIEAAKEYGIKIINCKTIDKSIDKIEIVSNDKIFAFHDKEIIEFGVDWFENILKKYKDYQFKFVRELK